MHLIKGEALTIRAYAHFDILRMFGPIPDKPSADPILPYVTEVSKNIVSSVDLRWFCTAGAGWSRSGRTVVERCWSHYEIFIAANLTPANTGPKFRAVLTDDYYNYRQVRMNYYAVLALKARVYNWLVPRGDANRQNAIKYAQMVIDARDRTGKPYLQVGLS